MTTAQASTVGNYLEDGKRLFRVLDKRGTEVRLENCRYLDEAPQWYTVDYVLQAMRLVEPG